MYPPLSFISTKNRNQHRYEFPLGRHGRGLLVAWSLFLVGGFSVAAGLEPDLRGYGTHQQLGLPPCEFRRMFDIACPSCGMTTSFSNFVRGRLFDSAQANAAGLVLATLCAVQIPWCWWSAWRGRLWMIADPEKAFLVLLLVVCAACLFNWMVQILFF
jgi:hypothetical protein